MSYKQTFFNPEWEDPDLNPQWSPWLKSVVNSPTVAKCTYCQQVIHLSNMGKQAITSHTNCKRHKKFINSKKSAEKLKDFLTKDNSGSTSPSISNAPAKKSDLNSFVTKDDVLSAELIWAMKLVFSHTSYNSFNDAAAIFQKMFDDSSKAKSMTLGRAKMAYLVSFGLAPYFKNQLISTLKDVEYVICFDEALNKIVQRGQMDLYVRFWNVNKEEVSTRYLCSVFLGHSTASDLLKSFFEGISELDKKKLLQVSLDGPNVNLKFLRDLRECLINDGSCNLLDIGSCGLHVVHGAFRTGHGATGWHLNELFKDMHRLFKNSPARRADYISITGIQRFPLRFCDVRWCENIRVAERAIEVFPHLKNYIETTKLPHTVSVDRLKEAIKDKLIFAKISFFISVANVLYPFLKTFQTAEPKCPFLHTTFYNMLLQIMSKFLKREVLREATTPQKLMKVDITDQKNYCSVAEIDIGIAAGANLAKSNASDALKKEFRIGCRAFLIRIAAKILERSPFKYNLVKYVSSLDPNFIISNETLAEKRAENLLHVLYENEWINSAVADKAKMQYKELLFKSKGMWKDAFINYPNSAIRLDHFYRDLLNNSDFLELWKIVKLVLILSHGNASVESGFSINKDMLVENLHESSLVSLRTVYDSIKANEGILNIDITPDMLRYARSARSAYHQALEDKKKCEVKEKNELCEKRKAKAQIKVLESKKQKLSRDISLEVSAIDSQIAELKQKM